VASIPIPLLIDDEKSALSFIYGADYFWVRTGDNKFVYVNVKTGPVPYTKEEFSIPTLVDSEVAVPGILKEKLLVTITTDSLTLVDASEPTVWTFSYSEIPLPPSPIPSIFSPVVMANNKVVIVSPEDNRFYFIGPIPLP
jgi:hypothetical protein